MAAFVHCSTSMRTSRFRLIAMERGTSYDAIARGAGVGFSTVASCGRGLVPGPATRQKLATFLGVDEFSLWPAAELPARAVAELKP